MWIAVEDADSEFWSVFYEVTDCNGTKGVIGLLAEGLDEQTARILAHRFNN